MYEHADDQIALSGGDSYRSLGSINRGETRKPFPGSVTVASVGGGIGLHSIADGTLVPRGTCRAAVVMPKELPGNGSLAALAEEATAFGALVTMSLAEMAVRFPGVAAPSLSEMLMAFRRYCDGTLSLSIEIYSFVPRELSLDDLIGASGQRT